MATNASILINLNGEEREVHPSASIADILLQIGQDPATPKGIAVAVNDEVVGKSAWPTRRLAAGDHVEVITARQGG